MATALKYFTVYFLSGLKFVFGPTFGVANNLPVPAIIILTALGMMTTIYLFTFFGDEIRRFFARFRKKKRIFSKKSRRFVRIWRKFGLKGMCLLTPLILTPPGGGLLVNLLGSKKKIILKWMWISALLWSTIITLIIKYAFWLVEDFIPS
ncbi:hypothetical protein SAMN05421640_1792 [Ekhidna lutea]|uniref:Small multi-drug export protein n=1 Tax=Ekhidna lutea TaxID=447679 RepID=A0A239IR40_EKHLU|nr:hypothetical protein [Ekhidna lutea]SNS96246.1 hypothetical protein SAMN05421640_1792 [Ekhidna lutea]